MHRMSPSNRDNFFKDHMNVFAYYDKRNQKVSTINLWFNGYRILYGATIVKNFETYKNMPTGPDNPPDLNLIMSFFEDNIIDETRIITCFENFMKGYLLLNGIVVHKLAKVSKELKQAQRDRPVTIDEVFTPESFMQFDDTHPEKWETNFQTLNFSWMLKPSYQSIINLPADVLELIKSINEERNRLHFISMGEFQFGQSTIEKYGRIIEFADTVIKKCIIDLDSNMKDILSAIKQKKS
jgi:hypothetical protein